MGVISSSSLRPARAERVMQRLATHIRVRVSVKFLDLLSRERTQVRGVENGHQKLG